MMKGLISQSLDWITHPTYADTNPLDWAAFVVLILIIAFLWTTVVKQTAETVAAA